MRLSGREKVVPLVLLALALGAPAVAHAADAAQKDSQTVPASWQSHRILVDLQNLPRDYTCNDLWYRFRDILFEIGARPVQILPYDCGKQRRSPRVQLQFRAPQELHGKATRWADVQVNERTVQIAPGHPASIKDTDCELVNQIKNTLLATLGRHVVASDLSCSASGSSQFSLTVQTLMPAAPDQAKLAAGSR